MPSIRLVTVLVLAAWVAAGPADSRAQGLPGARPESVGFSSERLTRLDGRMQRFIDDGQLAGIVTAVARDGRLVDWNTLGYQDRGSETPMSAHTIFRIYSMTKPITGVAMMMLYEEGKWHPDDPLAMHVPELEDLLVYAGTSQDGEIRLEEPGHEPTVGELMTHTAGFTYGFFGDSPVDRMYQQDNPLEQPSLEAFVDRLAEIPLAYQPGERWVYSVSVDLQGYLVEKLSGQPLPEFMRTRIFEPLGMSDTGFAVPESKLSRLATVYAFDGEAGALAPVPHDPNVTEVPGLPSGGGGLYSTAGDYLRFAQMLANGGELEGTRLLAPGTVELMRRNHLDESLLTGEFGIGFQRLRPGFGFGYDVAVIYDPAAVGSTTGTGSYFWDGAAGTWFWVDPENGVVFIGMIQRMAGGAGGMPNIQRISRQLVYQALVEP